MKQKKQARVCGPQTRYAVNDILAVAWEDVSSQFLAFNLLTSIFTIVLGRSQSAVSDIHRLPPYFEGGIVLVLNRS